MYQKYLGIDIGKESFSLAIHGQKDVKFYDNNPHGFEGFIRDHKNDLECGLVVLETTGGYEMPLIHFLQRNEYAVHRANTRKVKHFIRSYGRLGKSDTIDALGLAHYGFERHESLPLYADHPERELLKLVNRRYDLKQMLVQEKNRRQAPEQKALQSSFDAIIQVLESEITSIEVQITGICDSHPGYNERIEILKTIPGIGTTTAIQLLTLMPELGRVNRKQIASLGGVAPHPYESGKKIGYRFTRGGRPQVKSALFMSAMSASRSRSDLGECYEKFIKAGKKKMVAMTAIMRKTLVIANARIRDYYASKEAQAPEAAKEMMAS